MQQTIDINLIICKSYIDIIKYINELQIAYEIGTKKDELIMEIMRNSIKSNQTIVIGGVLETHEGYGFLRHGEFNFHMKPYDIYVGSKSMRSYGLRSGDLVKCSISPPMGNSKLFSCYKVISINGHAPKMRPNIFREMKAIYPDDRITLEKDGKSSINKSCRMIDLIAPIGYGQRMMIVAAPKVGKTTIMRSIAKSIEDRENTHTIMLLIGERPEEVTDTERSLKKAEVIASTFDENPKHQIHVAEMAINRAKRLAEQGVNVVVILDSISRLARAYNYSSPSSGKVLSGGVETSCLYSIKKLFGSARNLDGAGSVTIIATCLVDTGSRMDEVVFEELKGTGNSELYLDQDLARANKFPAINLHKSGTRKSDGFIGAREYSYMMSFRGYSADWPLVKVFDAIYNRVCSTESNKYVIMPSSRGI